MAWWSLVAICLVADTLGAVIPGGRYNQPSQEELNNDARGRQLYYLPQIAPSAQFQRLKLDLANHEAQYVQANQPKQDVEEIAANELKKTKNDQTPAKLETLEPDAELIPGAQQPQGPPAQVPVAPQPSIPGLLPGQRFYIVHPQHQIYQNPIYPGLPNGFRPNIQVPGYQRFYIVQAQPTVGDGSFANPAGYQNSFLVDPIGQGITSPQILPPQYQRLITSQKPSQDQPNPNVQNYEALVKNTDESVNNYQEPLRNYQQNSNYALPIRGYQHQADYTESRPQQFDRIIAAGAPSPALPFFGFGRQIEYPFQQQELNQLNANQIPFSRLVSLQPQRTLQLQSGQFVSPGLAAAIAPAQLPDQGVSQAQGRNDYSDEKKEDASTEIMSSDESSKKSDDVPTESRPQEPKIIDESKKDLDDSQTDTVFKANEQRIPK